MSFSVHLIKFSFQNKKKSLRILFIINTIKKILSATSATFFSRSNILLWKKRLVQRWILKKLRVSYYSTKKITSVQCKCLGKFFEEKNKLGSNNSEMYNSARNGKREIRRLMAFFGGCGGFAAVSLQFLNNNHKSNCHTKAQCCNSFFG